jgi:hypothetical protein
MQREVLTEKYKALASQEVSDEEENGESEASNVNEEENDTEISDDFLEEDE